MSDDLLEQGIKLIRQAFATEGKRAADEFVANLQSSIVGTKADVVGPKRVTRHPSAKKSIRAPAGSSAELADKLDYWIEVIGDRIGRDDRRFSETAKEITAALRSTGKRIHDASTGETYTLLPDGTAFETRPVAEAGVREALKSRSRDGPYCKDDQSCCDFCCGN